MARVIPRTRPISPAVPVVSGAGTVQLFSAKTGSGALTIGKSTMSGSGTATGSGGFADPDLLDDNFQDRSLANPISLTTPWTDRDYTDGQFTEVNILQRSDMTSELLADPRIPVGKTRFLECTFGGSDESWGQSRVSWETSPGVRRIYVAFFEYRPTGSNRGGEKWVRIGNRIGGPFSGGNRGHDLVFTLGASTGLTFISNSGNSFDFGNIGLGDFTWNGALEHWEFMVLLSTSTNSDGAIQVWRNGTSIATASGLRMNRDAGDAARDLELVEIGGWSSTNGGSEPGFVYPITRIIPQWWVSSQRIGVRTITTTV